MELLDVQVTYTKRGRKMSGTGTLDGADAVSIESSGIPLTAAMKVVGTALGAAVDLGGKYKGLVARDAELNGTWGLGGAQMTIEIDQQTYRIVGSVLDDQIAIVVTGRAGGAFTLKSESDWAVQLEFSKSRTGGQLVGEVERAVDAAAVAVLMPVLVRNAASAVDAPSGSGPFPRRF